MLEMHSEEGKTSEDLICCNILNGVIACACLTYTTCFSLGIVVVMEMLGAAYPGVPNASIAPVIASRKETEECNAFMCRGDAIVVCWPANNRY